MSKNVKWLKMRVVLLSGVIARVIVTIVFCNVTTETTKSVDVENTREFVGSARDSYVNAYKATQGLNSGKPHNRELDYYPYQGNDDYNSSPVYYNQQNGLDYGNNSPKVEYGPQKVEYGSTKVEYGPQKVEFGPQKPEYAPPNPIYEPPPSYYHYVQSVPETSYGIPYSMFLPGLLDKIKYKLNLFTIGKIILKLVIFKKIVSLIAILCLLMFIPTLKHKESQEHDDDGMMRNLKEETEDRIDNMTGYIIDSMNQFSNKFHNSTSNSSKKCGNTYCKSLQFLKYLDEKYSYKKLATAYFQKTTAL